MLGRSGDRGAPLRLAVPGVNIANSDIWAEKHYRLVVVIRSKRDIEETKPNPKKQWVVGSARVQVVVFSQTSQNAGGDLKRIHRAEASLAMKNRAKR